MDELVEASLSTNKKDNQDRDEGRHRLKNTRYSAHQTTPEVEVANYFSVGT